MVPGYPPGFKGADEAPLALPIRKGHEPPNQVSNWDVIYTSKPNLMSENSSQ